MTFPLISVEIILGQHFAHGRGIGRLALLKRVEPWLPRVGRQIYRFIEQRQTALPICFIQIIFFRGNVRGR